MTSPTYHLDFDVSHYTIQRPACNSPTQQYRTLQNHKKPHQRKHSNASTNCPSNASNQYHSNSTTSTSCYDNSTTLTSNYGNSAASLTNSNAFSREVLANQEAGSMHHPDAHNADTIPIRMSNFGDSDTIEKIKNEIYDKTDSSGPTHGYSNYHPTLDHHPHPHRHPSTHPHHHQYTTLPPTTTTTPPEKVLPLHGPFTYKYYGNYDEIAYTPQSRDSSTSASSQQMCHVVVTCRSLTWTVLSIVGTLMVIGAVITPQWLVGKPRWVGLRPSGSSNLSLVDAADTPMTYRPTVGIFNRCTKVHKYGHHVDSCATYVTGFDMSNKEFPDFWKSSLVFFIIGCSLLSGTVFSASFSVCVRNVFGKSIFTVTGLVQSVAAIFLVVGLVLYPAGWGSHRVQRLCGSRSQAFLPDQCSLGWAMYVCIFGTLLIFVSSALSMTAESSTSTDRIRTKILTGRNVICVM